MKKPGIIILIVAVVAIALYIFLKNKKKAAQNNTSNPTGPLEAKANLQDANGNRTGMSLLEDPNTGESSWVVDNKGGTDGRINATALAPENTNTTGLDGRVSTNSIPRNSDPNLAAGTTPVVPLPPLQTAGITPKTTTSFTIPKVGSKQIVFKPGKIVLPPR